MVLAYVGLELGLHGVHVEMGIGREDVNGLEVVFLSEGIVVDVVRRCYFEATCTEADLYITVLDDRNDASHTRHDDVLAFEPLVLFFLGVDANGYIAEDGLRTGGSHDGVVGSCLRVGDTRFRYFVAQIVELGVLVMIDDLLIGEGSLALRIPVDHSQSAVDEPFLVEVAEYFDDRFGAGLVHGERRTVPVAGTAEFAELFENNSSVLVGPFPGMFQELFAGEVGLVYALLFEAFDDLCLGGNRGMVGTGHPAGVLAFEACTAYEDVLYCLVEHVSHVEDARYVGRRNNDGKRIAGVRLAMKEFVVQPVLVPAGFDVSRIVLSFHKNHKLACKVTHFFSNTQAHA